MTWHLPVTHCCIWSVVISGVSSRIWHSSYRC